MQALDEQLCIISMLSQVGFGISTRKLCRLNNPICRLLALQQDGACKFQAEKKLVVNSSEKIVIISNPRI